MACESFVTYFANIWLFSAVCTFVILQVWWLRKLHTASLTSVNGCKKKQRLINLMNKLFNEKNFILINLFFLSLITCMAFLRYGCANDFLSRQLWQMQVHKWNTCNSFRHCVIFCETTNSSTARMNHRKCYNGKAFPAAVLLNFYVLQWISHRNRCICDILLRLPYFVF